MQLRQLQYFVAVAEQLNFRKAAENLYVTQPLLSKQISDLETEIGYPLFVRNTRSVTLTPAGEVMLKEANRLLHQSDSLIYSVRHAATHGDSYGLLRIAYEEAFTQKILGEVLSNLLEQFPGTELKIERMYSGQIKQALENNLIDIGFVFFPDKHMGSNMNHQIISYDTLSLAISSRLIDPDAPIEEYIRLSHDIPICLLEKNSKGLNLISKLCQKMGVYTNFIFTKSIQDMLLYAESGSAITVMPSSYVAYHINISLSYCDIKDPEAALCMAALWNTETNTVAKNNLLDLCPDTTNKCGSCPNTWCWANLSKFQNKVENFA